MATGRMSSPRSTRIRVGTPAATSSSKTPRHRQTRKPRTETAPRRGPSRTTAPDSLVEAVQQELIRRGYFGGKVDAMYGPDTRDALRKFQQDHHLADTGLINEATLHALQLD